MGAQMLRKKSNPQPGKLATKGGYLFSKGKSFPVLPENRNYSKRVFQDVIVQVRKEGTNLGPQNPRIESSKFLKTDIIYIYIYTSKYYIRFSNLCFPGVFQVSILQ